MTKENLIFLGTVILLSTNPHNLVDTIGQTKETSALNAINWATTLYERVHSTPKIMPAPKTRERWQVQFRYDGGMEWKPSGNYGINSEFSSHKAAEEAMHEHKSISADMKYRVHKIN